MTSISRTAFADEFGNNSFKFDTQGSHFIVATIICQTDYLDTLKNEINRIRKKHNFQTGEIKSSGVAKNHSRRKRILQDIAKLNISVYAVIVDKRKLKGNGFKYKKSFYKFLNNLLYKELFRTYPKLDLYVDEHGGNDYMLEFKKYVQKHHTKTLFSGSEFNMLNSKTSEYIQLADFVAGTLGYIFDKNKKSEHSNEFKKILKPKISSLNIFPSDLSFKELQETNIDETFDVQIAQVSYLRIKDFLEKEIGTDQQKIDQINFLKLMILLLRAYDRNRYITSNEIFKHLNQNRKSKLKKEYFSSKVIGSLRDKGILIASGRKGYKIPTSLKDIESFIKHGNKIIMPMLNRISVARDTIKLATINNVDLLEKFEELKKIIDNENFNDK